MTSPSDRYAPGWYPGVRPFPEVAPMEPAFGFTVLDPFGSAIVHGPKRIENRGDEPPLRLRSRAFWILVHTGARLYPNVTREDFRQPHRHRLTGERVTLWPACPPFAAFEPRAIIGAARVVGSVADGKIRAVDLDEWAIEGQAHWILDPTTIALPEPFPWPVGELGLWAPKATDENPKRAALGVRFIEARDAVRRAMADPRNHRRTP